MSSATNTDDVFSDPTSIPGLYQEAEPGITRIVDIHVYDFKPEEPDTHTIETTLTEESPQLSEWQEQPEPGAKHTRPHLRLLFVVLIVLFILVMGTGGLAYFLLFTPTATVTIIPTSTQLQTTSSITIDTENTHPANNEIAGRSLPVLSMSQTQTQATTGTTHQEARPGRGTITLYNAALFPQTIVASTLLTGADGIQVATDQSVTVPAARYPTFGVTTVTAHTVLPGTTGNIRAGDIYGSCCVLNIQAVNSAFTGGQEAQTYQSVARQDIETIASSLKTSLTQAVTTALQTQVGSNETLLTPTCNQTVTTDHKEGDKATQVQVTVSESCSTVAYDTPSFHQLVTQAQTHAATQQQREHYQLSQAVQATIQATRPGSTQGTYLLTVRSTGTWVYHFTQEQLTHLATTIAGKQKQQATQLLMHTPGIQQVSFGSSGYTLPGDPRNIHMLLLVQQ